MVAQRPDGRFDIHTSADQHFISKTVFIAAGVGAFQPRLVPLDDIDRFDGTQVFYRVKDPEQFVGKNMVICGGGDSALDWALYFADKVSQLTLIHRRDDFKAAPKSVSKMRELCDTGKINLKIGQLAGFEDHDGKLSELFVAGIDGAKSSVRCDVMLAFFGLSPKLGPIAEWGLDIDRKQITVDTEKFQTSTPGIFAVGDINLYPGKKKLILSGFHEAALAAFAAAAYMNPEKTIQLQYTTTSTKLHKVLGVGNTE
jgi:thioredoxin reductase (NADPH)